MKFVDDNGALPDTLVSELNFVELPRPAFAFNWQVLDDCEACNGDGVAERGEDVTLLLDVTNSGKGKALDSFAQIKNAGEPNIFIEKGRFKLGEMAPGETKTARFQLSVKKAYTRRQLPAEARHPRRAARGVRHGEAGAHLPEKAPAKLEPKKGLVKLSEKTELFTEPRADAPVVARLPRAATVNAEAAGQGFYARGAGQGPLRLRAHPGRPRHARQGQHRRGLTYVARRSPPDIKLDVDPAQGGLVVNGNKYTLSGEVSDAQGLLDMYVLVNDQKVYFQGVEANAKAGTEPHRIKFTTEFSLKEGNNSILLVARESTDFASRRTLVIRRRPAEVAQQLTAPGPASKPVKAATP